MKQPNSIFILNIHSDRNAGDYALSRVSVSQLKAVFPNAKIILSMNDPDSYTGEHFVVKSPFVWIKRGNKWLWIRVLRFIFGTIIPFMLYGFGKKTFMMFTPKDMRDWTNLYLNSDLVVSTAGGYQYSSGRGITFLLLNYIISLSFIANKPHYFLPQSFGPFAHWWEKIITRVVCNMSRIVMVREEISLQNLIDCGVIESKLVLHPDLAFSFKGKSRKEAEQWFNNLGLDVVHDRPFMGITIIDWQSFYPKFKRQKEYEEAIIGLIEFFINNTKGKVFILPQTWGPTEAEDDRVIALRLEKKLEYLRSNLIIINQPICPELLQTIFGTMDIVVGTRMHSNIFAITHGTPTLPIGYLHKSLGIAKMLRIENWVIDINEINKETLLEKFSAMWQQRDNIKKSLSNIIFPLINSSEYAAQIIAENYYRHDQKRS